jgi:transcriptional regulator with XRE-family HTH domain
MTDTVRLGTRLRAARKAAGFKTSKEFLKKFKVPASTYSQHESGKRMPDDETLKFYSKAFEISFGWLAHGKGSPFSRPTDTKKSVIEEELLDLSALKKNKNPTFYIDKELLTIILMKIISLNQANHASFSLPNSVKDAVAIYTDIMITTHTKEARITAVKRFIKAYIQRS